MTQYTTDLDLSTNVFNLHDKTPINQDEPIESLVLMLEDMLAAAKSGKLISFDGVGFFNGGQRITARGPRQHNPVEVIGAIELLKTILLREIEDDQ